MGKITMEDQRKPTESLTKRTLKELKARRKRIIEGKVNVIPSPFKRFSNDFVGIEQATYYTVTAATKGGKSQFASYVFIYEPLMFCYNNREHLDVELNVIYFPLEESKERIMQRFMSWLIYEKSNGKYHFSPKELRSTSKALDKEILEFLETEKIKDILDYFEKHVIFPEENGNPTGIYNYCKKYAEEHGTVHYKKGKYKDEFGQLKEINVFDWYEPNNPNAYNIVMVDTVNLIDTERGMNTKEAIDKFSEYSAKYLRNRYGYSIVAIHQQAFSAESIEAIKANKMKPSVASLGDSKYTSRDANVVLGIYSPFRLGVENHLGYDITKFRDNIRFLEMLVNRDGEMGGVCPLFFDGAVCKFKELPKHTDTRAMSEVYKEINKLRELNELKNKDTIKEAKTFFIKSVIETLNKENKK